LCRTYSKRLSALKPQLDANNVRMIGIGLEEIGVEQFVEGKFWDGELYIDTKKEAYQKLGFRRMNLFNVFPAVFSKKSREVSSEGRTDKVGGDFKGDGMQNGGSMIVSAGGKECLLFFKQENPGDHVPLEDVLKALKIEGGVPESGAEKTVTCNDDVCTRN